MDIVVDSCCDLSPELREKTQANSVPLTIDIGHNSYIDDGNVDISSFVADMKSCTEPAHSACPSPASFAESILRAAGDAFVVTLSSRLSGSHNAAVLGCEEAMEQDSGKKIHVFDSQSASAGETYIALMLRDLIQAGRSFEEIVSAVEEKIVSLHTLFVLDSMDNLVKNGRVSRAIGALAKVLNIRLLMSDDGTGGICQLSKARGIKNALSQMIETCRKHTEGLQAGSQRLVISYCNCRERALEVMEMIRQKCPAIGEIILTPTGALSAMYAYDGGIVIAY